MLIYECSVCGGRYNSNAEWLRHLIQEEHQKLARREMLSWSEGLRARVIVVFGKHPVGWNSKIIEKLSKDGETVVLDFVWWEERPKVGFVQFQNRETVSKVLSCLEDERFQIEDQVCQVMDGGTIAGPEWRTLFPSSADPSSDHWNNPHHPSDDDWTGETSSKRIKLEPEPDDGNDDDEDNDEDIELELFAESDAQIEGSLPEWIMCCFRCYLPDHRMPDCPYTKDQVKIEPLKSIIQGRLDKIREIYGKNNPIDVGIRNKRAKNKIKAKNKKLKNKPNAI